ncbi:MAG: hypothetical protein ABIY62_06080 [Ginsengibacter sp.]
MTIEELNLSKVPIIIFDKKLDELSDKVLFPEKLAKSKEILAKGGLPQRKNKITASKTNDAPNKA